MKAALFKKTSLFFILFLTLTSATLHAEPVKTYTDPYFFYSIDYPDSWRLKTIDKTTVIKSPRESESDDFSENVNITAENLAPVGTNIELIDYYRRGMWNASRLLEGFKVLEEAKTVWLDRDAIVSLYTMSDKGRSFKCKTYTFMEGKMVYVLTYTATETAFEALLPTAESIIRSIQVSP